MEPMSLVYEELEELGGRDEAILVHAWRAEQLCRLGLSGAIADAFASAVDWHELADLVARGCPPALALEIVL
jgi:hypothetical protein